MSPLLRWLRTWRVPHVIIGIALALAGVALLASAVTYILAASGAYDTPLIDTVTDSENLRAADAGLRVAPNQSSTRQDEPQTKTIIPALFTPRIPTHITIPTIGVDSPIVEVGWQVTYDKGKWVSTWDVVDSAVGYHRDSVAPGQPGNTVLSGHNNTKGEVFRNLGRLRIGESISVYVGDREYRYVVTQKVLLDERGASQQKQQSNIRWIERTADERLTLVSCWPYSTNSLRLIVVATRE